MQVVQYCTKDHNGSGFEDLCTHASAGWPMGVRGAVLPGDFGGIRGLYGGFPGGLTERAPSLAL